MPLAVVGGLIFVLIAQDDGGFDAGAYSSYGDLGYTVYGDTSPYPTGNEPLPGLENGVSSTGLASSSGPSGAASNPAIQGGGPASTGGFSVSSSNGNTATGSPFSTQANVPTTPELWPAPADPIMDRANQDLDPNTPNYVRQQYEDLLRTQQVQYQRVYGDPAGNARELANDLLGAAGGIRAPTFTPFNPSPLTENDGGDSIPYGEELHNQLTELGKTNDAIHSLWQQYGVPQLKENPSEPQFDPGLSDRYSVQGSDSAPAAVGQHPTAGGTSTFDTNSLFQLQMSSSPVDFGLVSSSGPADPGGIDFRSIRCVFLSEHDLIRPGTSNLRKLRFGLQAIMSKGGPAISFRQSSRFSEEAFFAFLSIPDKDLWVNLHPAEPDRIIPASLGATEVGQVMLKADLQLKRDAGQLMRQEPFASAERAIVDSIVARHPTGSMRRTAWGSTGRVEISSATSRVFANESPGGIMIYGVILDVTFEQKSFRVLQGPMGSESPLAVAPEDWSRFLSITEQLLRPQLIRRINQAAEYEDLRQAFAARVLADWYKRNWRERGVFSNLINQGVPAAKTTWDPKAIWLEFKRDYDNGTVRGFGGVSFDRMPTFKNVGYALHPNIALLGRGLSLPHGVIYGSAYTAGTTYIGVREASRLRHFARWLIVAGLAGLIAGILWLRRRYV